MAANADAQHQNTVPKHQPFSLSYTYDHVAAQTGDEEETKE